MWVMLFLYICLSLLHRSKHCYLFPRILLIIQLKSKFPCNFIMKWYTCHETEFPWVFTDLPLIQILSVYTDFYILRVWQNTDFFSGMGKGFLYIFLVIQIFSLNTDFPCHSYWFCARPEWQVCVYNKVMHLSWTCRAGFPRVKQSTVKAYKKSPLAKLNKCGTESVWKF